MAEFTRVLVIDDDEDDFVLTRDLLTGGGFRVEWAPSYRDGAAALGRHEHDICLLDYHLGEHSGLELLHAVPTTARIPVIMLTGQGNGDVDRRALAAGAADYLVKDRIDAASLERSVRYALERQRALLEVQEREAKFRALFENNFDAMMLCDDGGIVRDCNAAAETLFGLPRQALCAAPSRVLGSLDGVDRESAWKRLLEHGRLEAVGSIRRADGEQRRLEVRATARVASSLHLVVARDVTEREHMRERAERAERLASIGRLAAGVAHEVNNPLSVIAVNLELLAEDLSRGATTESVEIVRDARDAVGRVRDIVRELQGFAAPNEASDVVDLNALVDGSLRLVRNELSHRAAVVVRKGEVPRVRGQKTRLGQVIVNLAANAFLAIPDDGRAHHVTIETLAVGERVRLVVTDDGVGMTREQLQRAFEPFYTTRPFTGGMGLGLSICQTIVEAHDGEIAIESEPGSGTRVTVTLPAVLPQPTAPEPPKPAVARRRVLVIDDDEGVRRIFARVLRNHECVVVGSAREALALFDAGERYDAVLCDVEMPEMSGSQLHATVQSRHPELADRFVFVSGGAFRQSTAEFLERLADDRKLQKPFTARAVEDAIAAISSRA